MQHTGQFLAQILHANSTFAVWSCGPEPVGLALFDPQKTCFVWHSPLLFGSTAAACIFAFFGAIYPRSCVCVCMCLLRLALVCLRFEYSDYFEVLFWVMSEPALPHTFGCAVLPVCFVSFVCFHRFLFHCSIFRFSALRCSQRSVRSVLVGSCFVSLRLFTFRCLCLAAPCLLQCVSHLLICKFGEFLRNLILYMLKT